MFSSSRFASITINLGPTFLSGALAANSESYLNKPSCPLIQGPFRHYVLNVLWIFINVLCVLLTMYHLYKLYKALSRSNLEAVRVASLVTTMISVNQVGSLCRPILLPWVPDVDYFTNRPCRLCVTHKQVQMKLDSKYL